MAGELTIKTWRLMNPETGEVLEVNAKTAKGARGQFKRYLNDAEYYAGFTQFVEVPLKDTSMHNSRR